MLAEKNNYLNLGYELLEQLSADERKRLEERAERKAIMDYRDIMMGAEQRGLEQGIEKGIEQGRQQERQYNVPHKEDTLRRREP